MNRNKKGEAGLGLTFLVLVIGIIMLFALGSCEPNITKETHNGHQYLIRKQPMEYGTSMVHDPDCHCFKQTVEKPY